MFFIFRGTQQKETKFGHVAEFCPICRKITPFQVTGISMVSHLYGVSLGQGQMLGHSGTCAVCGTMMGVNASDYSSSVKKAGTDVEALIRQTFPSIRERRAKRLELEERVRSGLLSPAEREALLTEPFQMLSDRMEATFQGSIQIRGRGAWGCLGTFFLCIAVFLVGAKYISDPGSRDQLIKAVGILAVLGGLYSLVQLCLEPGRMFSRDMFPHLVTALRPLKPTQEELASILERFKRAGSKVGKKVKAERLWKAIQAEPASLQQAA